MRAVSLWTRRYHVRRAVIVAALELALWRALATPVHIPGRGPEIEWVLSPLIPSLLAMGTPDALQVAYEDSEVVTRQPVARRRLGVTVVILVLVVAAALLGEPAGESRLVAVRNGLLLIGIAFWSALLLPGQIAWSPSLAIPLITWLIGTPDPGQSVPGWALLLRDHRSMLAAGAAALNALSGSVAYVSRGRPFSWVRRSRPRTPRRAGVGPPADGGSPTRSHPLRSTGSSQ